MPKQYILLSDDDQFHPYTTDLPDGFYTYPPTLTEQNDPEYLLKADSIRKIAIEFDTEDFEVFTDTEESSPIQVVALYLVDRAYGGPEEGGWWYDYGEPVPIAESVRLGVEPGIFTTLDEAKAYRDQLEAVVDGLNEGRRPISSVASEGVYALYITEDFPKPFPDSIPRYE